MTIRRQRREDPAYLTAMREAKELFDAEMAKNSMKGRGRPKTVVVATPAAAVEVEIDHEVTDEIADLALFLCSDAASFITGAVVVCDGGQSLAGLGISIMAAMQPRS